MKILFTGGGTGGHFYPIIAIAEEINTIVDEEKIVASKLYFMSNSPYDKRALFDNGIEFLASPAGKRRTYFSLLNFFDIFKTMVGILVATLRLFAIYPDVVVGKGGYASFPVLYGARLLRIPVIIHESDSVPGRVNLFAAKFAKKIAVSYEEAATYFPKDKVAWTGQPIRKEIQTPISEGAFEYLKLDPSIPVILVLGGSQGAQLINDTILDALPELLNSYQVIHQVGARNLDALRSQADVILEGHPHKERYLTFGFLNVLAERMATGISTIVISRAGSTIFEIAQWQMPAIVIPITNSNGDHQRKNAFSYARAKACIVIEETNLTPHLLTAEVDKLMTDAVMRQKMKDAARAYSRPDAAKKIARAVVNIALSHEE